ncbi:hypothetical protein EN871_11650 [bacterium M00.F.Ca.ET.228.01.1.1]|uniref:hypothetical protein n=1 Tax=Paraburkholderia phenoliruptrix TaxID=252970 RepID=UPI00109213BF|nr:hypothetical protein [Paraburkholderia phenoliruptrix]TGP43697.1 hypothetical protein EN871_11650 [bacterium M00.F.Ca.ET.228.01.1.1]TGS01359.1 hypothetical protein EN834_11645 [bacterium M00.F.Ca.ET.191.01.1.1]TGU09035.1 hypothetical protein EN798_07885 [bacterium M00.F.Ca.ET.155.01.1.1]MBW0449428.1 hypothetical protein [Paraburkholderia phenoliruptrix]MBW9097709.1 hypothetical protein [Paraburkholderia phenoliruptrix]
MMKDSGQKQKAIRYCVAMGTVPYLEVLVRYNAEVSDVTSDITDIDVLGIKPSGANRTQRIVFDCKTLAKVSGISRAFWAAGLKQFVKADDTFVILAKAAPEGHRLAVGTLGVRLFSEPLFDRFAAAASKDYFADSSYLERMDAWEQVFSARKDYPRLEELINYLTADAPLEENPVAGFRSLLAKFKRAEGEIDSSKAVHRAIFGMMLSQALIFLSEMACALHDIFDAGADAARFEKLLRYYVWGGKENYELRQRLNIALKAAKGINEPASFDLPNWDQFKELMRAYLDAPFALGAACLPMKEISFREISPVGAKQDFELSRRLKANNRIHQFSLVLLNYFSGLTRLTKECCAVYSTKISELSAMKS